MEEDKLLDELKSVTEEIRGLKRMLGSERKEHNQISLVFFLMAFGVAITLYSAGILNEAIDFKAPVWLGYLGVFAGIFCMLTPLLFFDSASRKPKKK